MTNSDNYIKNRIVVKREFFAFLFAYMGKLSYLCIQICKIYAGYCFALYLGALPLGGI